MAIRANLSSVPEAETRPALTSVFFGCESVEVPNSHASDALRLNRPAVLGVNSERVDDVWSTETPLKKGGRRGVKLTCVQNDQH